MGVILNEPGIGFSFLCRHDDGQNIAKSATATYGV